MPLFGGGAGRRSREEELERELERVRRELGETRNALETARKNAEEEAARRGELESEVRRLQALLGQHVERENAVAAVMLEAEATARKILGDAEETLRLARAEADEVVRRAEETARRHLEATRRECAEREEKARREVERLAREEVALRARIADGLTRARAVLLGAAATAESALAALVASPAPAERLEIADGIPTPLPEVAALDATRGDAEEPGQGAAAAAEPAGAEALIELPLEDDEEPVVHGAAAMPRPGESMGAVEGVAGMPLASRDVVAAEEPGWSGRRLEIGGLR